MIENFGVQVANPEQNIVIEGQSFAELICYQHLHTENLKRLVAVLQGLNPDAADELLSAVQINLQGLSNASAGMLSDCLRIALAQGLRFELMQTNHSIQ